MAEVKPQFTEIKLSVPWGHIAARTYGSSTGKPVLMVHGRQDNAGSFTRLMKYLPMDLFYYVCIDLPGHGWSSHFPSWQMIDITDYAHTLHFIFEALQWETCIYIGHSMGGQLGLLFSVFQPHRIEKLILLDGIFINSFATKDYFTSYLGTASELSIKASRNEKQALYTKEEVLHALKNMRVGSLNSKAAEELFERAVTEVNGKYIYNRDVRLKNSPLSFMDLNECQKFNNRFSIPIYCIIASHGVFTPHESTLLALETMKSKTLLEIINIDGNHDVHNNNPEKVAPFICKILNSDNSSKL
jgi:pimeloyl-ACP methyl ester carboxylesterase